MALRLSYLPFRAMAETTRFIFRYGCVSYEDEVVWGRVFSERRLQGEYPFDKVLYVFKVFKRNNISYYIILYYIILYYITLYFIT